MDHLAHFGLRDDPFTQHPLERMSVRLPHQDEALERLHRAVAQGRSLAVLTGEQGSGKTTVARALLDRLEEDLYEASLLVAMPGSLERGAFLERALVQLGEESPGRRRREVLARLYDRLASICEEGRRAVIIVDEAQLLRAPETLEEIRGLLNFEYDDRLLISLVLVGLPGLDEALARCPALAGRIDVRVRLGDPGSEATRLYLEERIRRAGGDPGRLLEAAALDFLHRLSRGRPGRLNRLADNALYEAWRRRREAIGADEVGRAAADLGLAATDAGPAAPAPREDEPADLAEPGDGLAAAPAPREQPASGPEGGSAPTSEGRGASSDAPETAGPEEPEIEPLEFDSEDDGLGPLLEEIPEDGPPKEGEDEEIDTLFDRLVDGP